MFPLFFFLNPPPAFLSVPGKHPRTDFAEMQPGLNDDDDERRVLDSEMIFNTSLRAEETGLERLSLALIVYESEE